MKNGFTLVELLAVISIIMLLGIVTTLSVSKILNDSKKKLNNNQIQIIKDAASVWTLENPTEVHPEGYCTEINLGKLREAGLLTDVKNYETLKDYGDNDIRIIIHNEIDGYTFEILTGEEYRDCSYLTA